MTFVMQSVLLLISGVYYSVESCPRWMQVLAHFSPGDLRPRRRAPGLIDGDADHRLWSRRLAAGDHGRVFIPLGHLGFGRAESTRSEPES